MKCPAAFCSNPVVEDAVVSTASLCVFPTAGQQANSNRNIKGKGKAIPLQAWTGPEGYRRLKLPDLKTIGT